MSSGFSGEPLGRPGGRFWALPVDLTGDASDDEEATAGESSGDLAQVCATPASSQSRDLHSPAVPTISSREEATAEKMAGASCPFH